MTSAYSKRAVKRDPTAPLGQPARLYWIDCECGRCVPIAFPNGRDSRCDCGIAYDARGWIVAREGEGTDAATQA